MIELDQSRIFCKIDKNLLQSKAPNQLYTLCIPYTSTRYAKLAYKLIRLLKIYTPNYHLDIACHLCQDTIIGENKRQLQNGIK